MSTTQAMIGEADRTVAHEWGSMAGPASNLYNVWPRASDTPRPRHYVEQPCICIFQRGRRWSNLA